MPGPRFQRGGDGLPEHVEAADGGLTSYLEYLEIQRQLFSSELRASATLQLQLTSLVELYKALGGGWNPAEEPEEVELD